MFEPAVDKVCVGGNVIELTFVWRSQGVPFAAFKSACPRFGKNYKSNLPHVSDILLFGARTPYCESRREEMRSAGWPSQSARRCLAWSASPAKPGIHAHIQSPRKRKRGCRGSESRRQDR